MSNQLLLSEVDHSVAISQLGPLIKIYKTYISFSNRMLSILYLSLLALMAISVLWIIFAYVGIFLHLWSDLDSITRNILFAVPFLGFFLQLISMIFKIRTPNTIFTAFLRPILVHLHTDGFVYQEGRKRHVVPWEQLKLIQRQVVMIKRKAHYAYQLHRIKDSPIILRPTIADLQELGASIEAAFVARHLPQLLNDYHAGKQVIFPGLCLTQRYLSNSKEKLSWDQVREIQLDPRQIVIRAEDTLTDWLVMPVWQIPNACLLERFLTTISHEHEPPIPIG